MSESRHVEDRPQPEEPATPAPLRKLPMPEELDGGFQDWRDEWVALNGEPPSPHDVWKADHLRIFELEAERDRLLGEREKATEYLREARRRLRDTNHASIDALVVVALEALWPGRDYINGPEATDKAQDRERSDG